MGKAKASAGLRIGEGALRWASLSGEDAGAALIAATGCSASELIDLWGEPSLYWQVAKVLCENPEAVLIAWVQGELDVEETRAALFAELSKLVPSTIESGDNGDV